MIIRKKRKAEVNIVPLVDVLIVLIFFFLVTMQFRNAHILNLTMPELETAGKNRLTESIEIAISPDGIYYYNGKEVGKEQLTNLLKVAQHYSNRPPVLIMADESTDLKNVTWAMDLCRKHGLNKIKLQAR